MLIYVNITDRRTDRQTDRQKHKKYSSEPHNKSVDMFNYFGNGPSVFYIMIDNYFQDNSLKNTRL
jgi:hypothetical protein